MYKKKKKQKKYRIQFFLIPMIAILIGIIYQTNCMAFLERFTKDIGASIENFFIPNMKIEDLELISQLNQELKEENEEMKKLLDFTLDSYQLVSAKVIKRDISWYHELTINKGKKEGIQENMAVVSHGSLIGKIVKTTNHSSTVRLLTSSKENMKVAVNIEGQEETYHGILNGYFIEDKLLQIKDVAKNSKIAVGDIVTTNGLGGIYPSGIHIGTVTNITYDSLGIEKIVYVKINTNYDQLRYVMVVGMTS